MDPSENPVYATEPARRLSNGYGLCSILLGLVNIALILITVVFAIKMVSDVNAANGITFADYEVLGDEEIDRMFSEYWETDPVSALVAGLAGCLSVPVMLVGSVLGCIGLMQSNAPKLGSILGLILNFAVVAFLRMQRSARHRALELRSSQRLWQPRYRFNVPYWTNLQCCDQSH